MQRIEAKGGDESQRPDPTTSRPQGNGKFQGYSKFIFSFRLAVRDGLSVGATKKTNKTAIQMHVAHGVCKCVCVCVCAYSEGHIHMHTYEQVCDTQIKEPQGHKYGNLKVKQRKLRKGEWNPTISRWLSRGGLQQASESPGDLPAATTGPTHSFQNSDLSNFHHYYPLSNFKAGQVPTLIFSTIILSNAIIQAHLIHQISLQEELLGWAKSW